ncbi:DUF4835 family protein [candidate division KSB1 bacterium]|nr:DUF4835 family protein [candidate division KSB1 bacterium]
MKSLFFIMIIRNLLEDGVNMIRVKIIFLTLLYIATFTTTSNAQDLKAEVTVTLDNLPLEQQEKLANFQQIMQDYINGNTWTNDEIDVQIPLTLQIFFSSYYASSFEDAYGLQILISDNSDVQYFDRRCRMAYRAGDIPVHSENNWNSLTSLIDFYVYLVIGDVFDKFDRFMGTPYFEKAKMIAEQAKFGEGRFIEGWDLRNELIQDVLSDENRKFREMKDFYYYGIFFAEDDKKKARTYCAAAVDMIEDIMKIDKDYKEKCQKFLSAHHIELIDLFKDNDDLSIFQQLIELDPEHADIYQEYL